MLKRQNPGAPEHRRDLTADGGALSMSHNDSRSFFNLSQLVLSAGQIKPSPVLKHSKVTYFEVEIVDVQSKKQICIVDKVSALSQHAGAVPGSHQWCQFRDSVFSVVWSRSVVEVLSFLSLGDTENFVSHNPGLVFSRIFTNNPALVCFRPLGSSVGTELRP